MLNDVSDVASGRSREKWLWPNACEVLIESLCMYADKPDPVIAHVYRCNIVLNSVQPSMLPHKLMAHL